LRAPALEDQAHALSPLSPAEIPLEKITPNPHQPRRQFGEAGLVSLAESLKTTGVIQPVIVRGIGDGFQLIAGERRWRAARIAGLKSIPAWIREVDGFTQAQMALVENVQREDLNPIDRATSYRTMMTRLGLTQAELASRLGEDRSTIANFVRLLDLSQEPKDAIAEGRLSLGHGKLLAGVQDLAEQDRLAKLVLAQDLSVRNLERLIREAPSATPSPREPKVSRSHLAEVERSITQQLGVRAQLKSAGGKGKGRLVLHYNSLEQFDEIIKKLGVSLSD
jgi:ParB family chromosome partitioning protein